MSERRHSLSPIVAAGIVLAAIGGGWAVGKWKKTQYKPAAEPVLLTTNRGSVLYQANCANCHGPDGRGDGSAAVALKPPPRDFVARPWRFDVTPQSISRVIRDGVPGTPMPAGRAVFSDGDVALLTDYVYELANSRPPVPYEPPLEERLLSVAGFLPLHGTPAPSLALENSAGERLRLADLKGKLVILHFWGTGCEHCLKEMPALKRLEAEWSGRGLRVLHVCTDADSAKEAQELLDQVTPGLTAWVDLNGVELARFNVKLLPTVWIVDAEGKAVGRGQGARDWDSPGMAKCIDSLLSR